MESYKKKILGHIISFVFLITGIIFVHMSISAVMNCINEVSFFGILINYIPAFDMGLILIGSAYLIEFIMTFKPLELYNEEK